ncbi:hypothetical protein FGO68_gene8877 [Halteria grandinella]|uniref:Uncharacterized protein n=1 Tax=Halteria grandinella TaxID=5974 RepID=A0A8J8NTY6_HALGN|nr:hypothetical protein FGO68_gene8877 [Halteria grandinella]
MESAFEENIRIAVINPEKCKPKKCNQECKNSCPINTKEKMCIEVLHSSVICFISEPLCIGCGLCIKHCPFQAIKISNFPKVLQNQVTHRYGANTFKLHRLPLPRLGEVLGLVGSNGIGKSTALKILAGKLQPNLGKQEYGMAREEIMRFFRGSELENYMTKLLDKKLKALIKVQNIELIANDPKFDKVLVGKRLRTMGEGIRYGKIYRALDFQGITDREIQSLSGGELQRFAIAYTCIQNADIYLFDEPSSFLDIKQRLKAAKLIRSLLRAYNQVIVVEHDLQILDYLSDCICVLYGKSGTYGVVTMPYYVQEGINIFLAGYIPTENMRFRDDEFTFKVTDKDEQKEKDKITDQGQEHMRKTINYDYPAMEKTLDTFKLTARPGQIQQGEIVVMLGQNGIGKTTLIKLLAGALKPDDLTIELPRLNISYKPQTLAPKFEGTVRDLFCLKIHDTWQDLTFKTEVLIPLEIESLLDNYVQTLSGGELQKIAMVLALAKPCDIYLIDEPSAYLDIEQRIRLSKVMKSWIIKSNRTAIIVEHDFIMASYLADKVIAFHGMPGEFGYCRSPEGLISGMNKFLQLMDISIRRDSANFRPRINKRYSNQDFEQKSAGNYFLMEDQLEEPEISRKYESDEEEY